MNRVFTVRIEVSTVLVQSHCTEYSQSRLSVLYSGFVETVFSYVLRWFHPSILGASMASMVASTREVLCFLPALSNHSCLTCLPQPILSPTKESKPNYNTPPPASLHHHEWAPMLLTVTQFFKTNISSSPQLSPPPIPRHPPLPHRILDIVL